MKKSGFEEFVHQFDGGDGGGYNFNPGRFLKLAGFVVIALILISASFSCFYTIEADEVGVVQRLGKYRETADPGLHFKLPLGIDKVTPLKVKRILKEEFGFRTIQPGQRTVYSKEEFPQESLMLTADLGIVDAEWSVQYRIKDPRAFLFNLRSVQETIRDVSERVIRQEIGDSSIDESITIRRQEIAILAKNMMQSTLDDYSTGIEVVTVELQTINPPEAVRDSFNEVNRARQEKVTAINEARREWNKEIPSTAGAASQLIEEAEGYKTKRINEAKGDVARFKSILAEYEQAKEITKARLYIEAMEEAIPGIGQLYVVDSKTTEQPVPIIDLNEIAASQATRKGGSQ
jgi:membrane protease subunit HflK